MLILRFLISLAKILLITFVFILIIDFFFGKKILKKFDNFFSKSQFYERLIRIDHPIYHHINQTMDIHIVYKFVD